MRKNSKFYTEKNSDRSTIIALTCCFLVIMIAISIGGSLKNFFDIPSLLIVVIGTILITIACYNFIDIKDAFFLIKREISLEYPMLRDVAYNVLKLSEMAHQRGVLFAVENYDHGHNVDNFFKEGIRLLADNVAHEYLDYFVNQNTLFVAERYKKGIGIFKKAAEIAPAMGLVGTMIGLVQMLASFQDVNKIGPAMALALITTFYGSILAYLVFLPLASKLERNANAGLLIKKVYLEGLLSVNRKENPRILELGLNNILPEDQQIRYFK